VKPDLRFLLVGAACPRYRVHILGSLFSADVQRSTIREETSCDRRDRYHIRSLAFGIA